MSQIKTDHQCTASVRIPGLSMPRYRRCSRAALSGTLFCGLHDETAKARREAQRREAALVHAGKRRALFLARIAAKNKP